MKITPDTSIVDLAFIVGDAMKTSGVTAVLTGGGAASVYAPNANQSRDLDFVLKFVGASAKPIEELGFRREGQTYVHSSIPWTLDFPRGPLMVGEDFISEWTLLDRNNLRLEIISATDCVRDRLCSFYYYKDFSGLEQALAVARLHQIDLNLIREWSVREAQTKNFDIFQARI
jgi:hypothetical protein